MRVRRAAFVDEYAEDGESVVLLADGRVVAVSALGTAVLDLLREGDASLEEIALALVARFGPPPGDDDGTATVAELVSVMSGSGLIRDPSEG